jgi:hypothetical protein
MQRIIILHGNAHSTVHQNYHDYFFNCQIMSLFSVTSSCSCFLANSIDYVINVLLLSGAHISSIFSYIEYISDLLLTPLIPNRLHGVGILKAKHRMC